MDVMTRDHGLRTLGVSAEAGEREIRRAYKQRSRPLKLRILKARRVREKDHCREELRDLVCAREIALGSEPPATWYRRPNGVPASRVLRQLEQVHVTDLGRRAVRSFFGLPKRFGEEDVRQAYEVRKRSLVRRYAQARSREEMRTLRRARQKLRTVRNFALDSC